RHPDVRRLLEALARLTTYANAPGTMSAGLAIRQIKHALANGVIYLDHGWQTLVDGLRTRAQAHGAFIRTNATVTAREREAGGRLAGVRLRDGSLVAAKTVVIALDAAAASGLLPDGPARRFAATATPVHAACLDVGLSRLPRPRATFALGIDEPLYFSVHSASARLAPGGAAMIHGGWYLDDETSDAGAVGAKLEHGLDLAQPGWRDVVVQRRFLPRMAASSALVTAAAGGLAGRPGASVPEAPGLFLAGDW